MAASGTISTSGRGSVTLEPDVANVILSVLAKRDSVAAARDDVAGVATAVIESLSSSIEGQDVDITTQNLNVQPEHAFNNETGVQTVTGYTFSQQLSISVQELDSKSEASSVIAALIDASIDAGGDLIQISNVSITISEPRREAAQKEARKLAVRNGIEVAELLATTAGVRLGDIVSIVDNTGHSPHLPVFFSPRAKGGGAAMPVRMGSVEVTATVSLQHAVHAASV